MEKIETIYDFLNMIPTSKSSAEVLRKCAEQGKMNRLWDYILYNVPCQKMVNIHINDLLASCKVEIWEDLDLSQEREAERRNRLCWDSLE